MVRRTACLVIGPAATVLAVAAPTSAAATRECFLLTHCTSVVGPWVVIPAADPTPIAAGTLLNCPDSDPIQLAVGSDYEQSGGAGGRPPYVTRLMPGPGIGLIRGASAYFFAVSLTDVASSFRPHLGCIPQPGGQAALRAPTRRRRSAVIRIREVRVHPTHTVAVSHRCRAGERLIRGFAAVLFHRRRPPTARELSDVTVSHRRVGQRVRARVSTGPTVGDHERVTLQVLAVCRR